MYDITSVAEQEGSDGHDVTFCYLGFVQPCWERRGPVLPRMRGAWVARGGLCVVVVGGSVQGTLV